MDRSDESGLAEVIRQANNLTDEEIEILDSMSVLEAEYLEIGMTKKVNPSFKKGLSRSAAGGWDWRDRLICVTDHGIGTEHINTWHCCSTSTECCS